MIDKRKVYLWKWPSSHEFVGIALDTQIHERAQGGRELWFDDTIHGHMIPGEIVQETDSGFIYKSKGCEPGEWIFKELTIEEFRRTYFKMVEEGSTLASFIQTTEDLHEWYRKKFLSYA